METVDLEQFYSGGYFLVRAGHPGWEQLKGDLLPQKLLSLSKCICPQFDMSWGWTGGNKDNARDFGIPAAQLDEFVQWCQGDYRAELDMWGMFYTLEATRRFIRRFIPQTDELRIIGVGLPRDLADKDWSDPLPDNPNDYYGIEKQIDRHLPLEPGGEPLGFEVVSFSYSNFGHSWLCNYLHQDMHELFAIRPGPYGLIQSEAEARQVYDWIAEDNMQGRRAEPEPYDYWLLISYPLQAQLT
jgi:hypothetical protein